MQKTPAFSRPGLFERSPNQTKFTLFAKMFADDAVPSAIIICATSCELIVLVSVPTDPANVKL